MEEFIFHSGVVPLGYSFSFTESLFNQHAHRQLQAKSNWHSFFLLNQKNNSVDGLIHFHLQDGVAQSPLKAPYGGFDFNADIQNEMLFDFVKFVEQQLKKLGATKIIIKLALRLIKEKEFVFVEDSLLKSGFQILRKEEGCILKVTESYAEHIHYSKRKRLNKAVRNNFQFITAEIAELTMVYLFLQRCRKEKMYTLSISLEEMNDLGRVFPDKVLVFVARDGDKLVAASICIRINNEVLYDFYHDHDSAYDEFSPVVFLVKGIHDYCNANQIPLLDLGTAMTDDSVNTGLLKFKLQLGADRAVKYSFETNYR